MLADDILLAASLIWGVLIRAETSSSSMKILPSLMSIEWLRITSATLIGSSKSIELRIAKRDEARYIAPVSRYEKPSRSATSRAVVLFPEAAGPSMAITLVSRVRQGHTLSFQIGCKY